ncbi:hypothetical protein ZOSMA_5G02840 [Zostera marina]|uniref:Serine/threonine-protein kinase BSK1-like TPR repeats domain-containing protein n=1 Tax=Zostera marina TaxID=29655 RepID=A0A0K9NUE6_ZOSMR|nr:hypothetical protein ZOSMA_5G02840 [Zostera marina]
MASDPSSALAVREKVMAFLNAARTGNISQLKKFGLLLDEEKNGLEKTASDVKDANKRNALHFAAREGKVEMCRYLLEELKFDVEVRDEDGETPLIHAARQGHVETVKYLLQQGANHFAASKMGICALHHACGIGNVELMKLLVFKDSDMDLPSDAGTPLIWAAGHGKEAAVKFLLERNANPNCATDDGITPLLSAVAVGSLLCLELLIKAGATTNISAGGASALHIAADNGDIKIIKCLLKGGADPNIADEDGLKPIQVAALKNNQVVVKILLPLTSPIQDISDWTIDGLIEYTKKEEMRKKDDSKETELLSMLSLQKPEIVEVTPEAKARSLEAKLRGQDAFKRNDFASAVNAYTQAIDLDPNDAIFLSNRSLCWLKMGQPEQALTDAQACQALRPNWAKACYREGAALRVLQRFDEAANAFYEGVKLDPDNKEMVDSFREAVEAGREFHGTTEKLKPQP